MKPAILLSIARELEEGKEVVVLEDNDVGRIVNRVALHRCDLWITRRRGVTRIRGRKKT